MVAFSHSISWEIGGKVVGVYSIESDKDVVRMLDHCHKRMLKRVRAEFISECAKGPKKCKKLSWKIYVQVKPRYPSDDRRWEFSSATFHLGDFESIPETYCSFVDCFFQWLESREAFRASQIPARNFYPMVFGLHPEAVIGR